MDVNAIKAELYDLEFHNCNGRLTVLPAGKRDSKDRPCSGCQRVQKLHAMLREAGRAGEANAYPKM